MNFLKNCYKKILVFLKRTRLKNHSFSLIANNCCGGVIYNSLGERFNSPTINLFIRTEHYFDFLENLKLCLNTEITDISNSSISNFPVGQIKISEQKTIDLHFVHYSSFAEAKQKWSERKKGLTSTISLSLWKQV